MEEIKCYVHCAEQLQESSSSDTSEISDEEKCRARCITSDHILEDYIYRFTEFNAYDRHDAPATTTLATNTSSTTNVYCLLGIVCGVVFLTIVLISFYKKCRVKWNTRTRTTMPTTNKKEQNLIPFVLFAQRINVRFPSQRENNNSKHVVGFPIWNNVFLLYIGIDFTQ